MPSLLYHCSSRVLQWLCRLQAAFRIMWNKLRRSRTFLQCKFMLQTPVLLAELWLDARSCLEMGSAKFDRVELADEGALVLLIICVVSQGKCYFLFSSNTVCSARTVHQIPALVSSYSRCLKWRSQIPPQIPSPNCPLPKQGAASCCQGAVGTPHTHRGWVCFSGAAALTQRAAVPRHPVLPLPAPPNLGSPASCRWGASSQVSALPWATRSPPVPAFHCPPWPLVAVRAPGCPSGRLCLQ